MKKRLKRTSRNQETNHEAVHGNILKKAKPVSETDDYVTALFYGRSGTGKTTLASTFPKKILLLDFKDKGTDSIKDVEDIDVIVVNEWSEVEEVYWALKKGSHGYETLAVDTISGMQTIAIQQVKVDSKMKQEEALSRRNWGEVSSMMSTWLMNFRDLELHVVFLAPDRTKNTKDEEEEQEHEEGQLEPEVGPAVIPSIARIVNAAVKVIGNTYIKQTYKTVEGKRVIRTGYMLRVGPNPFYITKIRSPKSFATPGSIFNPSFEKIRKIMKGEELK